MTKLALNAIESPESINAEVASALDSGPGSDDTASEIREQWLLLFAAVLCNRPDMVNARAIAHLEGLLRDPALTANTCRMAGEVLKFSFSSPAAACAAEPAVRLLREPGRGPEVYEAAIDCLRWATRWAIDLLDADALLGVFGLDHLARFRSSLLTNVLEPCLYASETNPPDRLAAVLQLHGDSESAKYPVYFLQGKNGLPRELQNRFPWHEPVARRLGQGRRRVLVVHNINDGQGDEIVRTVPLVQALLDFNAELEVTLVTRRVYLYAHPRIKQVSIDWRDRVVEIFREPFDVLVDFFEPNVKEINYAPDLETAVEDFRRRCRPFLNISSMKGYNHFLYERVEVDSRPLAGAIGLDRRRVENNYEPTWRLIAELGLPLRRGQDMPRTEPLLAGTAWPEAEAFWQALTSSNPGRSVALLAPFGGAEPLKGYVGPDGVAAEIGRLVRQGYYVVVMPNGAGWGSTRMAQTAVSLLAPDEQVLVTVGPAPDGSPDTMPPRSAGGASLSFPDRVMSLVIRGIRHADLVVTVEGWMMHAAYVLGKPCRILMLAYSHSDEWHPYGRTSGQGVFPAAASPAAAGTETPPLLEQPRKSVFLFLLRELGKTGLEEALPFFRRTVMSEDRDIRLAAAGALGRLCSAGVEAHLAPLLEDPSHEVRAAAAQAFLDHSRKPDGVLREHLLAHTWIGRSDRSWEPVLRLGEVARPVLQLAANGDDPVVRREAAQALRVLDFRYRRQGGGMGRLKLPGFERPTKPKQDRQPKVLILTPVKDAEVFIPGYYSRITRLTYPGKLISLGFLESDSRDATYTELEDRLPRLRKRFRRVGLWQKDFAFRIPPGFSRWAGHLQAERRTALAKSRNHLLFRALDDEDWVLWLDIDVIEYPGDILEQVLAVGRDIVQPHCVVDYGGPTFDRNAWRDHGRLHLEDMRDEGELVELHAVGGTMLLVRADVHREGLIFPSWPYGKASGRARDSGELETEGLGIMALDMGYQCWGMPHLEIRHGKW